MKDLFNQLRTYGEILTDYDFEDPKQGCIRVTTYHEPATKYNYVVVMINGELKSISLKLEQEAY